MAKTSAKPTLSEQCESQTRLIANLGEEITHLRQSLWQKTTEIQQLIASAASAKNYAKTADEVVMSQQAMLKTLVKILDRMTEPKGEEAA